MTTDTGNGATRASLAARLAGRARRRASPAPAAAAPARNAAVLVPLIDRAEGMTVLLTRRSEHLDSHPGQIAFPGGRVDPGDRDAVDTALRETEEEVGLARARIDVVGRLDTCWTGTGYRVEPVVGLVSEPFSLDELTLDDFEVAEAFETPLAFVMDPANHIRRTAVARGTRRSFYVLPWGERYIWGATAHMLVDLSTALRRAP